MKRISAFLMAAVMVFSLAACGTMSQEPETSRSETEAVQSTVSSEETEDLICHQAEQQRCHQEINSHLDFHFWFHESFTLSHHLDTPSSATHSFTLLSASVTLEAPI